MKLLKRFFVVFVTCIAMSFTAFAGTSTSEVANRMAQQSPNITVSGNQLVITGADSFEELQDILDESLRGAYKNGYLGYNYHYTWNSANGSKTYYLDFSELQQVADEVDYLDNWLELNMMSIVPNGTSESKAVDLISDWILEHASYDYDSYYLQDTSTGCMCASNILKNGTGVCLAYSRLFRAMVEYLPFRNGVVDYTNGNYNLEVAIVIGYREEGNHSWNSVKFSNGTTKDYDLTSIDIGNSRSAQLFYGKSQLEMIGSYQKSDVNFTTIEFWY